MERVSEDSAMAETRTKLAKVDPVWSRICTEAEKAVAEEPLLGGMLHATILHHRTLEQALAYRLRRNWQPARCQNRFYVK